MVTYKCCSSSLTCSDVFIPRDRELIVQTMFGVMLVENAAQSYRCCRLHVLVLRSSPSMFMSFVLRSKLSESRELISSLQEFQLR